MCAERRFNLNVEVEFSIRFLHIDLFNQHPQVRFRHDALSENVVDYADIPFELRLPLPQDSGDILQFFDLLFCRSDFFFTFLDHAVIAFSVRPIDGSAEAPVVTRTVYPTYRGALVVCQGGDRADVKLAVTEAVAALTGLSADRITVAKSQ